MAFKRSALYLGMCFIVSALPACSSSDNGSTSKAGAALPSDDGGSGNGDATGDAGEGGASGATAPHATDSTSECERLSVVQCKLFYECFDATQLAQIADTVGTTETECVTLFNQEQCADTTCPVGQTYMPVSADKCVNNFATLSCTGFYGLVDATGADPAGCDSICE